MISTVIEVTPRAQSNFSFHIRPLPCMNRLMTLVYFRPPSTPSHHQSFRSTACLLHCSREERVHDKTVSPQPASTNNPRRQQATRLPSRMTWNMEKGRRVALPLGRLRSSAHYLRNMQIHLLLSLIDLILQMALLIVNEFKVWSRVRADVIRIGAVPCLFHRLPSAPRRKTPGSPR